jgi:plasmid stability protein
MRYDACMATIQVRDVPDDVAEVLRHRAEAAGRSLQSYMRDQLIAMARRRDKAEIMAVIEQKLADKPGPGVSTEEIASYVRELRGE